VSLPQGLILVTGPTGSGKTTSLYAALAQANDEGRKIVTIEDPVEYEMDGISQIQTRDDIGLTFAGGLRSVLRHDPDVVLVGEIRDHDTAQIAVRAAQTGHLVLSTLHANDSVGVIPRLIGMDMDPYLIAASLKASVAQRLTRRLCESCKVPENNLDASLVAEMTRRLQIEASAIRAWKGVGCDACQGRGFRGRVAVYEFLTMNDDLAEAITRGASLSEIKRAALQDGWQTLRDHALEKIQMGTIGLEELSRVTWRLEHTSSHSNSVSLP
jgi:type II secretory ATPase GspE/PulE/Tfp pilus assembly ATPase PilB-like protein